MAKKSKTGPSTRYNEAKETISIMLTPTAKAQLDSQASQIGITRSEFVEQIARGILPLDISQLGKLQTS